MEGVKWALKRPGSVGLILRFTEGELRKTTWKEFTTVLPHEAIADYNKQSLHITLKNGSQIYGLHCQSEEKIRSFNADWGHIDEVCEVKEDIYKQLLARLRGPAGPRKCWLTGNPEGRNWVYRTFVGQQLEDHAYFHGRTREATFLPKDYIQRLFASYDAAWVERFLEGSWDVFEGQVFPQFDRNTHVLPWAKEDIPKKWVRYRGVDHGWRDPTVCLWAASDGEGNLYVYDLYYQKGRTIEENVRNILTQNVGEEYTFSVADPHSNKTEAGSGQKTYEIYRACGLPLVSAKNNNLPTGIARLREMLEPREGRQHPVTGEKRAPRLYVLNHCRDLIHEMQQYCYEAPRDGQSSSGVPKGGYDHAIDALRYVIMHNPQATEAPQETTMADWIEHLRNKLNVGGDPAEMAQIIGNEWVIH